MTTYSTGTVSIGANATTLTGAATSWASSGIRPGDLLLLAGNIVPIAAVNSNTSITLARPWPGAAMAAANYDILLIDDGVRTLVAANLLLQQLTNGTLSSLAGLTSAANKLPYFSGAGVMALADLTTQARSLLASTLLSRSGNNLATTDAARLTGGAVTQSAVDTTSGRLLKVGDFGLGGLAPTIGDVGVTDNSIAPGTYAYGSTSSGGPSGIAWGTLIHIRRAASGGESQIFIADSGGSGATYTRARSTGAWTAWSRLDVLAGSNANGRYVRFGDGTQICYGAVGLTLTTGNTERAFPAEFSAGPDSVAIVAQSGAVRIPVLAAQPTSTGFSFNLFDAAGQRMGSTARWSAIGRW